MKFMFQVTVGKIKIGVSHHMKVFFKYKTPNIYMFYQDLIFFNC